MVLLKWKTLCLTINKKWVLTLFKSQSEFSQAQWLFFSKSVITKCKSVNKCDILIFTLLRYSVEVSQILIIVSKVAKVNDNIAYSQLNIEWSLAKLKINHICYF